MKKKEGVSAILFIGLILAATFVSAYNGFGGYGYWSPRMLLESDWFVFFAIFVIVYSIVYTSLAKTFSRKITSSYLPDLIPAKREVNKAPVMVISLAVSLLISAAITQRVALYGYLPDFLINWTIIIVLATVLILGLKLALQRGFTTFIWVLIGLWIIANIVDPWDILPSWMLGRTFDNVYEFFKNILILILLIVILVIKFFLGRVGGWGGAGEAAWRAAKAHAKAPLKAGKWAAGRIEDKISESSWDQERERSKYVKERAKNIAKIRKEREQAEGIERRRLEKRHAKIAARQARK